MGANDSMKVLIVGSGGREHAFTWKIAQSEHVSTVYVAPGNAGTALESKAENVSIKASDIIGLKNFALAENIDLTIVGPEAPLVDGISDIFSEAGLKCFGPSKEAAKLEGSKIFAKDFMIRHGIPTAEYKTFTDFYEAERYIKKIGKPVVIKADGLAAGKGVIIAQAEHEAVSAVRSMLLDKEFGESGNKIIVEEMLIGEEASFIVMVDGENILPLATSQDHKAIFDGDKGPNTGGMGAYSPAPVVTPAIYQLIMNNIIQPTVQGMITDGHKFTGFLYAGIMIDKNGNPKVLEFNVRCGDPETQPILMRLKSDLFLLCNAAVEGKLDRLKIEWDSRCSLGVVMASGGYPDEYQKGYPIKGIPEHEDFDSKVFHAGTSFNGQNIITSGGRVLCVTSLGNDVAEASDNAYKIVKNINWNNSYYRTDIGYKAIKHQK